MRQITGILLAAGESRRYGSHKLVAPLASGVTVGIQSLRNLRAVLDDVIVVVRPDDRALIRQMEHEPVSIVPNHRATEGLGASIACGVVAAAHADAWLIALGDMPSLQTETLRSLVSALQHGCDLVAPVYQGRRGHPVGFGRAYSPELLTLTGDTGARHILTRHAEHLTMLTSDDPGVLFDIDLPSDRLNPITS